jgi:hypothetical protein
VDDARIIGCACDLLIHIASGKTKVMRKRPSSEGIRPIPTATDAEETLRKVKRLLDERMRESSD